MNRGQQREKIIIERRALGHSLRRIGADIGLSAARVSQMESQYLQRQAWMAQAIPNEQMTDETRFLDLAERGSVRTIHCIGNMETTYSYMDAPTPGDIGSLKAVTVGALRRMPDSELRREPNFGTICLAELRSIVGYAPGNAPGSKWS
jgi:hypothetical protein